MSIRLTARALRPTGATAMTMPGFDTLEHVTFFTADGVDADPALLDRIAASGVVVSVAAGSIPAGPAPHPVMAKRLAAILASHRRMFRAAGGERELLAVAFCGRASQQPHLQHALTVISAPGCGFAEVDAALTKAKTVPAQAGS
jgi:hypothetical protein